MKVSDILNLFFRYRPWLPYHFKLIASSLAGTSRQPEYDNGIHLNAVIDWLCRAQDKRNEQKDTGGVSAGWSLEDGWLPGYPETSGYIVETFVAAAELLNRPEFLDRAQRILNWEMSIQNNDGSFPGHFGEPGSRPVIFNTGQIMHGMVAGYLKFGRNECLEAALDAGRWMIGKQDSDGCWRSSVHNNIPHTYNTRAAWALLRTGLIANESFFVRAAVKNLEWALAQQGENGWFRNNAFEKGRNPFTHTIAYAIRGVLESGILLEDEQYLDASRKGAHALAGVLHDDGRLNGTFDENWHSNDNYCCLTGLAQVGIIWTRLDQVSGSNEFSQQIKRAIVYLKKNHRIDGSGKPEDGGVAGSVPFWGDYSRFEYPNWAAKFFADLLIMDMSDAIIP
ncbi:terpene cyclase/mutase family protein [Desulfobacula sp.]|uniref:prenyltransferase/squalene oxidase repeat-containing protein n=1 Tax=Desulfobacula sp. TaxID=2593537 RepID=UPI0026037D28|nr:terpene cyclase/mutase family protein [Desulfobacula sp.]